MNTLDLLARGSPFACTQVGSFCERSLRLTKGLTAGSFLPQISLSRHSAARDGIRYRRKLECIAIGSHAPKNKEAPLGNDDISLPKEAIVHCRFGSDPLELGSIRRWSLDATRLCGNGDVRDDHGSNKGYGSEV